MILALTSPPTKDLLYTRALVPQRRSTAVVQFAPGPALVLPAFKAPIHRRRGPFHRGRTIDRPCQPDVGSGDRTLKD
jgi:hypothetical protein